MKHSSIFIYLINSSWIKLKKKIEQLVVIKIVFYFIQFLGKSLKKKKFFSKLLTIKYQLKIIYKVSQIRLQNTGTNINYTNYYDTYCLLSRCTNLQKLKSYKYLHYMIKKVDKICYKLEKFILKGIHISIFFIKYYIPNYIWFLEDLVDLFIFSYWAYFFYRDTITFFRTITNLHTIFLRLHTQSYFITYCKQLFFYLVWEVENCETEIIDEESDDFDLDDLEQDATDFFSSTSYPIHHFYLKLSTFFFESFYIVCYSIARWIFKYIKYTLGRVTLWKFLRWHWRGYKQWNDIYRVWPDLPEYFEILDLYA